MSDILGGALLPWIIGIIIALILLRVFLARAFFSLVMLVVSNRVGRIVLGILLLISGFLIMANSHGPFAYQNLTQETMSNLQASVSDDGTVYLRDMSHSGTYYIIPQANFNPSINSNYFQLNSSFTSLTYNSNESRVITIDNIDVGTGYIVEQFTLSNYLGQSNYTFSSLAHQANPNGPLQKNWLIAGGVGVLGLLLLLFTLAGLPRTRTIY